MILLSAHDKDEYEIHVKSQFGVKVLIKDNSKEVRTFNNIKLIHWLPDEDKVVLNSLIEGDTWIPMSTFYWLSFEPATKIES